MHIAEFHEVNYFFQPQGRMVEVHDCTFSKLGRNICYAFETTF